MDIRRTILWMIFSFSLLLLWNNWQVHTGKPSLFGAGPTATPSGPAPEAAPAPAAADASIPNAAPAAQAAAPAAEAVVPGSEAPAPASSQKVHVKTDV